MRGLLHDGGHRRPASRRRIRSGLQNSDSSLGYITFGDMTHNAHALTFHKAGALATVDLHRHVGPQVRLLTIADARQSAMGFTSHNLGLAGISATHRVLLSLMNYCLFGFAIPQPRAAAAWTAQSRGRLSGTPPPYRLGCRFPCRPLQLARGSRAKLVQHGPPVAFRPDTPCPVHGSGGQSAFVFVPVAAQFSPPDPGV